MLGFLCSKHSRDRAQGVFCCRMGSKIVAFPSQRKHLTSSEMGVRLVHPTLAFSHFY